MIRDRLHLKRHVVVVIPRRLVVELDAAQRQPVRVDDRPGRGQPAAGVETDQRSIRQPVRRRVVRRVVDERELERVVVAEARVAAAILERAVEQPVAAAQHDLWRDLVGRIDARREIGLRHLAETAAELVGVHQLDAILRQVADEARRQRLALPIGRNQVLRRRSDHHVRLLRFALLFAAEPVPAQAVVHRQLGRGVPAVLHVRAVIGLERVDRAERRRAKLVRPPRKSTPPGTQRRNLVEQQLGASRARVQLVHERRIAAVRVVFAACVRRLRRPEEDVLEHVAALERVRLVHLRQVVAELRRVAEALAHHPAGVSHIAQVLVADPDQRKTTVAGLLRNAENPVCRGRSVVSSPFGCSR